MARTTFGIAKLKPQQRRAIEAVLAGRDTLAVLPTGFGKSLVYQVAAVVRSQPTIVISPLIALMADQEQALQRRGVDVVRIDSTLRVTQRREALARVAKGGSLVVLTTPESLDAPDLRAALDEAPPWLLCVDEAHSISEWGHDFRPAYLRLGVQRDALGGPVVLALTATATVRVREDIAYRLSLREPEPLVEPPYRSNLRFAAQVVSDDEKIQQTARRVKRWPRPGIIYCATTRAVDGIASALGRARIGAAAYHGRMNKADREQAQRRFTRTKARIVMVATSAFGMGIDKPDVRYVLHYHAPASLEQYVQEAGRAGRDGKMARCELLFDPTDLDIQRALLAKSRAHPGQLRKVAKALAAYADEGRDAGIVEIAAAAGVPQTVARSTCAQLEGLGVVHRDRDKRHSLQVSVAKLHAAVDELVAQLDAQRRGDERRLQQVDAYARTDECRSVFIRRYFGEEDPPRCGQCDRCRATKAELPSPRPQKKSRSRRRRGRRRPNQRRKPPSKG